MSLPTCDMTKECARAITHLGEKGYVYCAEHAECRINCERCRKLRPFELAILAQGRTLPSYRPLSKPETLAKLGA